MTLTQRFSNRRLLVDCLALMFGVGAWMGVNGIYVQLPLLVNTAPEGWSLPAYMVMLVQVANLGPVLYSLYAKYAAAPQDSLIISTLLGASAIATFTLAFIYQKTSTMFDAQYSTALLGLMFVTAVVGCTSSVLFMPFMRNYREIYLVSYLVGEGLSGFLPSVVALIQGVGGNPECINSTSPNSDIIEITTYYPEPRFSTQAFFIFLSIVLFMSFTSFIALTKTPMARRELVKPPGSTETLPTDTSALPTYKTSSGWTMAMRTYVYLLIMMALVCCLGNAALASIQSYSCLPYGNVAYHLTVTLGSMAGPLAMCLGFVIKNPKINVLSWLTLLILALSAYLFYLALQSPSPPFQNTWYGEFLVVISWILVNGLIGFVKMGITTLFRPDPGRGLFYTGVATQAGSLFGAITTFIMVNVCNMFQSYSPCA